MHLWLRNCYYEKDSGLGSCLNDRSNTSLVPFRLTPSHRKSKSLAVSCYNAQCHAKCHARCDARNGSSFDHLLVDASNPLCLDWIMYA